MQQTRITSFSTIYTGVTSATAMCWPLTGVKVRYVPSSPEPGLLSKQAPTSGKCGLPSPNGQSPESAAHCVLGRALGHPTLPVTTFATNLRLIFVCICSYNIVSSISIPLAFALCLVLGLSPCSMQQAEQGCCHTPHLPVQAWAALADKNPQCGRSGNCWRIDSLNGSAASRICDVFLPRKIICRLERRGSWTSAGSRCEGPAERPMCWKYRELNPKNSIESWKCFVMFNSFSRGDVNQGAFAAVCFQIKPDVSI